MAVILCISFSGCIDSDPSSNAGTDVGSDTANTDTTGTDSGSETPESYTVTIVVNEADYGTVSETSITNVTKDTEISVYENVLTIGETAIEAIPAESTAKYTYTFEEFVYTGATVTGDITVTAKFERTLNEYTVTVASNDTGYGTVNVESVTVPYGTEITADENVITIGATTVTATAARAHGYIYGFAGFTGFTAAVEGNLTVTANFTAEEKETVDISGDCIGGTLGVYGALCNKEYQTVQLPARIGALYSMEEGFVVNWSADWAQPFEIASYDEENGIIIFSTELLYSRINNATSGNNVYDCTIEGEFCYYAAKIQLLGRRYPLVILETAEDFANYFDTDLFDNTENGGTEYDYYSYVLANDIDVKGTAINNGNEFWANLYGGTIDGRGHVIKNVTVSNEGSNYGIINTRAGNAEIKNIAFVNVNSPRVFFTHTVDGITLENVFVSGVAGWGELFSVLKGNGATLKNVILKNNGGDPWSINGESIYDEDGGGTLTKNNYIKVGDDFWTDGLGESWAASGFAIENDTLYFHGKAIMLKGGYALSSAADFADTYETNGGNNYVLTDDIIGASVNYTAGTFSGTLDGQGHVLKDAVIEGGYGLLNSNAVDAAIKNIALVNLTGSDRDMFAYSANGVTVENVYVSGTCGWSDLFEEVSGNGVTLKNVILNFRKLSTGTVHGIADSGAPINATNVIVINDDYTVEDFFTEYAEGLPESWEGSGFTVENGGLYFYGTLILSVE